MIRFLTSQLTLLGLLLVFTSTAQEVPLCNQHVIEKQYFEEHPELRSHMQEARAQLEAETLSRGAGGDEVLIIPVVFHVIHNNGPENITDDQIYDAVEILNRDFRKLNPDTIQLNSNFADLASDIRIEFRLAQLDPDGNCTKGITRTVSQLTYDGNGAMRDLIHWPRDSYMNVWVCNDAAGAAGYTFLPSSVDNFFSQGDDGIVMRHDYTGSIGTSNVNRSRALTHEVGHWLNLSHTWGAGNSPEDASNCQQDDGVSDTPNTLGWTSCTLNGESCGSLDNVENYMEYSYCSKMFTAGQMERMRAAAFSSIAERNELHTDENLMDTGVFGDELILCAAEFSATDRVICPGDEIQFFDESYNDVDSWTWDFGDGTVLEGTNEEDLEAPIHIYPEPGNYTVTLTVEKSGNTETITKSEFVTVMESGGQPVPLVEGFEDAFPADNWFVIEDEADTEVQWETTQNAAYSGETSVYLPNRLSDGGLINELISSTIDASDTNGITISFRYAHANKSSDGSTDEFRLQVSGDCGNTWQTEILYFGNTVLPTADPSFFAFVPNSEDDWRQVTAEINDSAVLTENFMMRFRFKGGGGNNIYIDDININSQFVSVEELDKNTFNWSLFPNPAGERATARVAVERTGEFEMYLTDLSGRRVKTVENATLSAGTHDVEIATASLEAGVYFVVVESNNFRNTKRLVVRH
ncbi:M43 family zinc metalloprotease [Halocola ammonii]